jgi:structural maintenance of chromosomes protein 5
LEQEEHSLHINQQQSAVGVLEAYERRAQEIADIEKRVEERQKNIDTMTAQITEHRQIWEPRLQLLIQRVSKAFEAAFESIGCAGEVLLSKSATHDGPPTDDFEKWSILIKVKFRQTEELQTLTGQRQSGGERSVSTIFYLMALQDMAKAPFRVVDEINQGMDPRNERLVHERMVNAACRTNTSQYIPPFTKLTNRYFLITPKLLPGLNYHRNMKVLTVNNGRFVPQTLDVRGIIQTARALQES